MSNNKIGKKRLFCKKKMLSSKWWIEKKIFFDIKKERIKKIKMSKHTDKNNHKKKEVL